MSAMVPLFLLPPRDLGDAVVAGSPEQVPGAPGPGREQEVVWAWGHLAPWAQGWLLCAWGH